MTHAAVAGIALAAGFTLGAAFVGLYVDHKNDTATRK